MLCDFGLSRIKADATSRRARTDGGSIVGSRSWMAPEQLLGGSLKKPCDIYAFGITLYEVSSVHVCFSSEPNPTTCKIYANEIPLSNLSFAEFVELVVRQDVRPERPDIEDAPLLSDDVWALVEKCWVKHPKQRPTANVVCNILSDLCRVAAFSQLTLNPSPSHTISQPNPPQPFTPPPNLTLQGHTDIVWCATFSPDGKYIASGSRDHTIQVWDAQTGNLVLGPLKMHTDWVWCVAFSPNGRWLASGSVDKTILVLDATTGKVVAGPFKEHTDSVRSVAFSPDGKQIASGSHDNTMCVWDAQTGNLIMGPLKGHTSFVMSVVFSPDGKLIASGSLDKTVRVWNVKSGRLVHGPLSRHTHIIFFVAFSPDGKIIISATRYGEVCVWDATTGALVSGPSQKHVEGVLVVAFTPNSTWSAVSPDGRWIAGLGHDDSQIQVYNLKTGQFVATMKQHSYTVNTITFSPDSNQILSTSYDKTVHVHTIDW